MAFKTIVGLPDGTRVWINLQQVVKMTKTPDGQYFICLTNGENYLITKDQACNIESYLIVR
ncbi:MAG: hypothetical protein K6E11_04585 [Bacilli bacterium]|nr:hypothetical protein [Bacilli bacterium]